MNFCTQTAPAALLGLACLLASCGKTPEIQTGTLPPPTSPVVLEPALTTEVASRYCMQLMQLDSMKSQSHPQTGPVLYGATQVAGTNIIANIHYEADLVNGLKLIYQFAEPRELAEGETLIQAAITTLFDAPSNQAAWQGLQQEPILMSTTLRHIDTPSHGLTMSYVHPAGNTNQLSEISLDLITRAHQQRMHTQHFSKQP